MHIRYVITIEVGYPLGRVLPSSPARSLTSLRLCEIVELKWHCLLSAKRLHPLFLFGVFQNATQLHRCKTIVMFIFLTARQSWHWDNFAPLTFLKDSRLTQKGFCCSKLKNLKDNKDKPNHIFWTWELLSWLNKLLLDRSHAASPGK